MAVLLAAVGLSLPLTAGFTPLHQELCALRMSCPYPHWVPTAQDPPEINQQMLPVPQADLCWPTDTNTRVFCGENL